VFPFGEASNIALVLILMMLEPVRFAFSADHEV